MILTGDILLKQLDDGTWDWFFENGQPEMTNGLETMSMIAVFGEDWWGNGITKKESEKMKSKFPEVIRRNVVTDQTKNDGTKAIEEALSVFTTEKIAKSVTVTGEIFSAYGIQWIANIEALTDKSLKYFINWEKGSITAGFVTSS